MKSVMMNTRPIIGQPPLPSRYCHYAAVPRSHSGSFVLPQLTCDQNPYDCAHWQHGLQRKMGFKQTTLGQPQIPCEHRFPQQTMQPRSSSIFQDLMERQIYKFRFLLLKLFHVRKSNGK
ncbi:hypothetical protein IHE45_17G097000 [Dioscorea alata]|uniref:Uncharacterized protein n=1 Tax=Dioscorea alata TaxID=55571 RepID=A0ACB7UE63_DIOAL|nr:hypothetical protein IHE45_17G097000 [Dioscorea alata]